MPSTPRWKQSLSRASRSRGFLWKLAAGIILAGALVGFALHRNQPFPSETFTERILRTAGTGDDQNLAHDFSPDLRGRILRSFVDEVSDPATGFEDIVSTLPMLAPVLAPHREHVQALFTRKLPSSEAALASDFFDLFSADPALAGPAKVHLRARAEEPVPPRLVHHMLGVYARQHGDGMQAVDHFTAEAAHHDARSSRDAAIQTLIQTRQFDRLDALVRADNRYEDLTTPPDRLRVAIARKEWAAIFKEVPRMQLHRHQSGPLTLTLATGLAWAFFLIHLGENTKFRSATTVFCGSAFVLGALSTIPTLYASIWQDHFLQLEAAANSWQQVIFQVGGVGLREELCKLLLFLPLLPFLLKRGDEREALLVASFVGLGFAIEENGGYFSLSQGTDGPGRFLTANFLHIVLTGLNGLSLFRACASGGRYINEFLAVFPLTILVHGLYNGLPRVDELAEMGAYASLALYVLASLIYFNRAYELRENVRMTFSLTGAFILGLAFVAAVVLIQQITLLGPGPGLTRIVPEFLGVGVMVIMFTRVFNEGLSD